MSNTYGVNGTTPANLSTAFDAGVSSVSADSLLAYCQMQLGDLDGQINDQMTMQKTALREREAVQSAQNVLSQFGSAGPNKEEDLQTCVTALDNAAAQLPPTDPAVAQLADFRDKMIAKYHTVEDNAPTITSTFRAPAAGEWQVTMDALGKVADDVKSGAEIQMLHLQDLVSQRQQAIQLCSGIMSKTDQTLEDQAKAIGRG